MTYKQEDLLYAVGQQIAKAWINAGIPALEMDMDYQFEAVGDNDLVCDTCESAGVDIDQEWNDVWGAVRAGYQDVLLKEKDK